MALWSYTGPTEWRENAVVLAWNPRRHTACVLACIADEGPFVGTYIVGRAVGRPSENWRRLGKVGTDDAAVGEWGHEHGLELVPQNLRVRHLRESA